MRLRDHLLPPDCNPGLLFSFQSAALRFQPPRVAVRHRHRACGCRPPPRFVDVIGFTFAVRPMPAVALSIGLRPLPRSVWTCVLLQRQLRACGAPIPVTDCTLRSALCQQHRVDGALHAVFYLQLLGACSIWISRNVLTTVQVGVGRPRHTFCPQTARIATAVGTIPAKNSFRSRSGRWSPVTVASSVILYRISGSD